MYNLFKTNWIKPMEEETKQYGINCKLTAATWNQYFKATHLFLCLSPAFSESIQSQPINCEFIITMFQKKKSFLCTLWMHIQPTIIIIIIKKTLSLRPNPPKLSCIKKSFNFGNNNVTTSWRSNSLLEET